MSRARIAVASLTLSAVAFIGLVSHESYTETAVIPTKNDRPTVGYGSTFHADGTPVRMGDRTTPVRALVTAQAHISREEAICRKSLEGAELHQAEFDIYCGDWVYQYGTGAWAASDMRREILARNYRAACEALLQYRYLTTANPTPGWEPYKRDAQGRTTRWRFDCSTPGNKVCRGVWLRSQERHRKCMEAQ